MAEKHLDSEYSVQEAILKELGGDVTKHYDSPYSIQLEILDKVKQGGGGAVIDDENISPNTVWSSEKVYDELGGVIVQDGQIMTQELYDFLHHRPFPHNEHRIILKKGTICCEGISHTSNDPAEASNIIEGIFWYNDPKQMFFRTDTQVGQTIHIYELPFILDDLHSGPLTTYSSEKIENMIGDIDTILQTIIGA